MLDAPAKTRIAVIDLGPYLAGKRGALEKTAAELGAASEELGFYFIANHGIPQLMIDRVFAAAERFHSLPLERKLEVKVQGKKSWAICPWADRRSACATRATHIPIAARPIT